MNVERLPLHKTHAAYSLLDIGSNSVRLVVYSNHCTLAPEIIHTEKLPCQLGREIASTGRLYPDGIKMLLDALPRLAAIAQGHGSDLFQIIATAAVRDA